MGALGDLRDQPQGLNCTLSPPLAVGRLANRTPPREIATTPGNDSELYPAMVCWSVFRRRKTLQQPIARYGGGEARDRTGSSDDTRRCQGCSPAVPAPTRLSQELPQTKRTMSYAGWQQLPGVTPRGAGLGGRVQGRSPPACQGLLPLGPEFQTTACAGRGGYRAPWRGQGGRGGRPLPPGQC